MLPQEIQKHLPIYPLARKFLAAIIIPEIMIVPYPNDLDTILNQPLVVRVSQGHLYPLQSVILIQARVIYEGSQLNLICVVGISEPDPQIWFLRPDCLENV